jgi:hypothetical protein
MGGGRRVELEALHASVTCVRDLVLDGIDGPSSLATSLSSVAELLEGRIDAAAATGVHCGIQLALFAALSHFSELGTKLVLLGSGCNTDLMED